MDKRYFFAIGLSCLIMLAWVVLFPPPRQAKLPVTPNALAPASVTMPAERPPVTPAAVAPVPEGAASRPPDRQDAPPRREAPEGAAPVVVETDLTRIEFKNPGGLPESWSLKKYLDHEGRPYELISSAALGSGVSPLGFRLEDKAVEGLLNSRARFDVERRKITTPATHGQETQGAMSPAGKPSAPVATTEHNSEGAGEAEELRFIYSDGQGLEAVKTLVFRKDSYLVEFSASIMRNGQAIPCSIVWGPGIGSPTAEDLANRYYHEDAVADFGAGPKRYYAPKVAGPTKIEGGLRWIGLEESYFAAVFIGRDGMKGAEIAPLVLSVPEALPTQGRATSPGATRTHLFVSVAGGEPYTLFVGPKDYQLLQGINGGLAELVNFSSPIPVIGPLVGVLAKLLYHALHWLHAYIGNYGLAIIIVTTLIKIAFYPITQRTMVKMRAVQQQMQKVQPKIKAIREKYRKAKDAAARTQMNEDIMALYKREGINPMASLGGCLPLLLQLPILYAFYSVLSVSIDLRQAPFFGWLRDLSRMDPYWVTPILMGVSMFAQQKMAMTNVTDPQQRAQQRMMLIMPVIFTYTFLWLPSGLVLYWLVNNLLGIAQQALINRQASQLETVVATASGKA